MVSKKLPIDDPLKISRFPTPHYKMIFERPFVSFTIICNSEQFVESLSQFGIGDTRTSLDMRTGRGSNFI